MHEAELSPPKIAIVSGASSGIGLETSRQLSEAGYRVYGISRRGGDSAPTMGNIVPLQADVRDVERLKAVVSEIEQTAGRVDLLVNAAGVLRIEKTEAVSTESFDEQVETSLRGTFFLSQLVIPIMVKQSKGLIVNLGSIVGELPSPKMAAYAAAKAGIISLSKSFAAEYIASGVRVVCVSPGVVQTNLVDKMLLAMMAKKTPLQRAFTAEEIARFIVQTVVPNPDPFTGSNLTYSGGM